MYVVVSIFVMAVAIGLYSLVRSYRNAENDRVLIKLLNPSLAYTDIDSMERVAKKDVLFHKRDFPPGNEYPYAYVMRRKEDDDIEFECKSRCVFLYFHSHSAASMSHVAVTESLFPHTPEYAHEDDMVVLFSWQRDVYCMKTESNEVDIGHTMNVMVDDVLEAIEALELSKEDRVFIYCEGWFILLMKRIYEDSKATINIRRIYVDNPYLAASSDEPVADIVKLYVHKPILDIMCVVVEARFVVDDDHDVAIVGLLSYSIERVGAKNTKIIIWMKKGGMRSVPFKACDAADVSTGIPLSRYKRGHVKSVQGFISLKILEVLNGLNNT